VDPIEEWTSPPFEPVRLLGSDRIERIYARGAEDNKGQFMTLLEAVRSFIETTGGLPVSATFFVEGEEETGSPSLEPFLRENRKDLQADIALVCDTDMFDELTPAIVTRLRGLVFEEVAIIGPPVDLHSGSFGGPAVNPIKILAKIISELHDDTGKVAVPGFYDGVLAVPNAIRQQWADLNFDAKRFLANAGLKRSMGEKEYSVLEQLWGRPTLEINGIVGGYTGTGTKTIIPSQATAKISCRLVANQDPEQIRALIRTFICERAPADVVVKFNDGDGSRAVHIPESNRYLKVASLALETEWQRAPVFAGGGYSIPVVSSFQSILGIESLMIGFGLDDDATHSPNEKFDLPNFRKGIRSWIRVINALASVRKA
jgi:acetylornithine deacetylase/succinyl-diaminopimelate desuccinylase-like protein